MSTELTQALGILSDPKYWLNDSLKIPVQNALKHFEGKYQTCEFSMNDTVWYATNGFILKQLEVLLEHSNGNEAALADITAAITETKELIVLTAQHEEQVSRTQALKKQLLEKQPKGLCMYRMESKEEIAESIRQYAEYEALLQKALE